MYKPLKMSEYNKSWAENTVVRLGHFNLVSNLLKPQYIMLDVPFVTSKAACLNSISTFLECSRKTLLRETLLTRIYAKTYYLFYFQTLQMELLRSFSNFSSFPVHGKSCARQLVVKDIVPSNNTRTTFHRVYLYQNDTYCIVFSGCASYLL